MFRLFRNRRDYRFRGAVHEQIADVILEKNRGAKYQVAEDLVILHYGYLDDQLREKDKKNRNLVLLHRELAQDPDNRLLRYHYGVELYRAGRYAEAAAELVRAADGIDPQTIYLPKLLRYIVLAYHGAGMPDRALEAARVGFGLFPDYADLYYYAGLISHEQKQYAAAYEYLQKAAALPEQPVYYASFSGVRGFRAYYQLGQLAEAFMNEEEALRYYILSLRDNPSFVPALESITRILRPREDPAYAGKCLEQLCDFCTPEANLLMGQILFRQGAYRLALVYLERGMDQRETAPEMKIWQAICLMQQRRFLEALRLLDAFAPGHHLHPLAVLNKMLCFWFQGNRRKVRAIARELLALGLSPDTGGVVTLLRDSLGKYPAREVTLGQEGMALLLDIIARALDLRETERTASLLRCLSKDCLSRHARVLGELFYRYGCLEEAEHHLREDLAQDPASAASCFLLGEIEHRQGKYLEAGDFYRRALALDPNEPRHYLGLITLYQEMRRAILREARERYPGSPILAALEEEPAGV